MTINNAENRCLRQAPTRSVGIRAAVLYLSRHGALHKLDTPVSILVPSKKKLKRGLTLPSILIWDRGVPQHREL